MAALAHFNTKTHNRAVIKIVGSTTSDSITIPLKTLLNSGNPLTTGNLTFNMAAKTIVRATGTWAGDGFVVGAVVVVDGVSYSILSIDSTVQITTANVFTANGVVTPSSVTGYKSDFLVPGQFITGTPTVTISAVAYSLSSSGDATIVRNGVTIFKLWGHDTLPYGSNEQMDQAFVVTFNTSAGGTIELELSKTGGWTAVNPDYSE